ncbi:MAG: hypothetical protein JSC085_000999 [Candidatus Tokpelaia sp. JSC085]|nr:MAG: hypothetical protein JSC085_000999 [Candidatus Tokpelaia sp. JSC085]
MTTLDNILKSLFRYSTNDNDHDTRIAYAGPVREDDRWKGPGLEYPNPLDQYLASIKLGQEHKEQQDASIPEYKPISPVNPSTESVSQPNLLQRYLKSDISSRIQDYLVGLGQGKTPSESLAMGSRYLSEKVDERNKRNQTVDYLIGQGYSEQDAKTIASDPALSRQIIIQKIGGIDPELKQRQLKAAIDKTEAEAYRIRNPIFTPPSGYGYTSKGNLEPIKGGPVDRAIHIQEEAEQNKEINHAGRAQYGLETLYRLRTLFKESGAVGGSNKAKLFGFLHPSDRVDARTMISSLQGLIASDMLESAKAGSTNGASGFGNLSNVEYQGLANQIAALSEDMSVAELNKSFNVIESYLKKSFPSREEIPTSTRVINPNGIPTRPNYLGWEEL